MKKYVILSAVLMATLINAKADWIPLFDGKTLDGWKASEKPGSFKVVDGMIAADGPRSHLYYAGPVKQGDFKNFEFKAEVMAKAGANSGIFFHTAFQNSGFPTQGFEVQVNNTQPKHDNYHERKLTGSLYGFRNIYKQLVKDDEWFTLYFSVKGNQIQVRINDTLVVDYVEPAEAYTPASRPGRHLQHGTFALQCHDPASKVFFKNLMVQPLPDDLPATPSTEPVDDIYKQIISLGTANFPLVDFHIHLKGGLTLEDALANSRKVGINYGIAVNGGIGFPITNDAGVEAFLKSMAGSPSFVGLQAEGREWYTLFSPDTVAKFDYVFTDAMTIFDATGKRSRLWMTNEVNIPDTQAFMNRLVDTLVGILNNEPIDIYVNPTFLPEVIASQYDTLWTAERKQRVIEAAAKNGVAIEISSRYRLPKADFIKAAKKAGIKFTFGINNTDKNVGRCEYGLQMVKECGLTSEDMWLPKPNGQKPIQVKKLPRPAESSK